MQYLILILVLSMATPGFAGVDSWVAAKAKAEAENKLILVDFYAVWCGPCKLFDREMKTEKDLKKLLKKVVLFKVDAELGDGINFAADHQVTAYPTYVLFDTQKQVIDRWLGYEKSYFMEQLNGALVDPLPVAQKKARFAKQPSFSDGLSLANYHEALDDFETALKYLVKAESLRQGAQPSQAVAIFQLKYRQATALEEKPQLKSFETDADRVLANPEVSARDALSVMHSMMDLAKSSDNGQAYDRYLRKAESYLHKVPQEERYPGESNRLMAQYHLRIEKNETAALATIKADYPSDWETQPRYLNRFAWWCFENKVNLKEGAVLAEKGANLAESGKEKAQILDTQAEIINALGDPGKAAKIMAKALEEAPGDEYFEKQLKRFQELERARSEKDKS